MFRLQIRFFTRIYERLDVSLHPDTDGMRGSKIDAGSCRPEYYSLLVDLQELARDKFAGFLSALFDGTDDSFFELANHAHSNNDQNRFFEAMREIRIRRRVLEGDFLAELDAEFLAPGTRRHAEDQAASTVDFDALSLLQNDALEESVAVTTMVSKARAVFPGELLAFQARVSSLYSDTSPQNLVNPLDPEFLTRAFVDVCRKSDLTMEIRERLILFKQFDLEMLSRLGAVLVACNQLLVVAGVQPHVRLGASVRHRVAESAAHTGNDSETAAASTTGARQIETTADRTTAQQQGEMLFSQLQELLAGIRDTSDSEVGDASALNSGSEGSASSLRGQRPSDAKLAGGREAPAVSGQNNVHYIADRQLFGALSKIQQQISQRSYDDTTVLAVDMREALDRFLASDIKADDGETALSQVDEDLINLVSMLFEFILDDYNLSPPVQVLISRLQIPILKVAIRDKAFFSKPNHPARKLLNALARAGIGWSDFGERRRDKLYGEIHSIVDRILNEYDGDASLFVALLDEFESFNAREDRKSLLVEQRTRESEIGRVKSRRAHRIVERLLQTRIETSHLPASAISLLRNGWSKVMFLAFLKEESEHRFNQTVRVLDELAWCFQARINHDARERWVRIVPQLLKNLKSGLQDIAHDSSESDEMITELKRELTTHFKLASEAAQSSADGDQSVSEPELSSVVADIEAAKNAIERQTVIEDAALLEYLARVDQLRPGSWVEYSLVNGSHFRCKLSTVIDDIGALIFVNRLGLKVVEKSRGEVAHELRRGRVRFLEEGPLVDRAMEAVMSNLRKISGKAA